MRLYVFGIKKSTSRHIFPNVLNCIERALYSVYFIEMNLFENRIFEKGVFIPAS